MMTDRDLQHAFSAKFKVAFSKPSEHQHNKELEYIKVSGLPEWSKKDVADKIASEFETVCFHLRRYLFKVQVLTH
jgi:hypothetical protein